MVKQDVAGRAAAGGRLAVAADADLFAVLDAGGIFTASFSVLPAGRWTAICTSPPVMAVVKGICISWIRSSPFLGSTGPICGLARRRAELAEKVAQAAGHLLAETLAEELAQVDVLGIEAARAAPGPPPPAPGDQDQVLGPLRIAARPRVSNELP